MGKRIAAGLLVIAALMGAACSSDNDDSGNTPSAAITPAEAGASEEVESTTPEGGAAALEEADEPGQGSLPFTDAMAEAVYQVLLADPEVPESITDQQMRCIGNAAASTLGEERIVELGIDGPSLEAAYGDSGSFLLGDRFGISQAEIDEILGEAAACADWRELLAEGLLGDGGSSDMTACFAAEISDLGVSSLVGGLLISPESPLGTDSERAGQEMARLLESCLDLRSLVYDSLVFDGGVSEQSAQCVVDNISDDLVERYLLASSGDGDDEGAELMGAVSELLDIQNQCLTPEELEFMGMTDSGASPDFAPVDEFGSGPCPLADGSGPQVLDFDGPQAMCLDPSKQYTAVFATTAGEMRVALDTANTPYTANNFAVLARHRYYDDTLLFRTDPSIGIIQGGAPHTNSPSDPGPGYTIPDEGTGFTYEPGQIVMARTAAPNSAGAQFFFAVNENTALLNSQGTYVVFGQMDDESLAVAEAILASHVDQPDNPLGGGPEPPVIVNSVTIEKTG